MTCKFVFHKSEFPQDTLIPNNPNSKEIGDVWNIFSRVLYMNEHVQYESSITAQVGGSDFSALGNAKYVKICLVVY